MEAPIEYTSPANMEPTNFFSKNIVLFGLTGSGKDTIAKLLEYECNYFIVRIAGTIKQIIREKYNFSEEELETQKRINKQIREDHHEIGYYLDTINAVKNRIEMIINGKLTEFKYKSDDRPIVVCDGRSLENELKIFLEHDDWICIFLSRTSNESEYTNKEHWTEQNSIEKSLDFIQDNMLHEKSIIIINNVTEYVLDEKYDEIASQCLGYFNISKNSTEQNLLNTIHYCIKNDLI